tara:strand:+ start:322 stop:537 length:216 start_codon:yes stop_codon:yes gene_type:complete
MKQVFDIVGKTLGLDASRITTESHFVDHLGADDWDTLEICEAIEKEMGVKITEEQGMKLRTVQDLINIVTK